jgi:enoyl-CoA hydratase/carnithine racemase
MSVLARTVPAGDAKAGLITLNRPEQLNPIDGAVLAALDSAVSTLTADAQVRALLITGAGRAFSAGGDLEAYLELQRDPVRFPAFVEELHRVFGRLRSVPVPTIALVNGVTAAGGLELLLNCDVAIAARSARIGDGHLNFGMMGGGGVLTLLPRFVGVARARELLLSGRFLEADEAAAWGLVSRVVDDDALLGAGVELAATIAEKSPLAVANAKEVMNAVWAGALPVDAGLRIERERNAFYCLTSHDAREGLEAFAAKRTPRFTGA